MQIQSFTANRWSELQDVLERKFCGNQWVFRGQSRSEWTLATKLERICQHFESTSHREAEKHLLIQFQRRLHHYRLDVPALDDSLEWLALMQHHGAPTRLLDWTKAPYVAAYFAIEKCTPEAPACIWVVNIQSLHNKVLEDNPLLFESLMASEAKFVGHKEIFKPFVLDSKKLGVVGVEPFRMNERMAVQQGVFLVPMAIDKGFLPNLIGSDNSNTAPSLRIDLNLDYRNRLNCLEELRKMNIHRGSLFPGIDGFAQSLNTEIEIWGGFTTERILLEGKYNELP